MKSLKSPVGVVSSSASSNPKPQQTTVIAHSATVIQVRPGLFRTYVPVAIDASVLSLTFERPAFAYVESHRKTSRVNSFLILRQQGNLQNF